MTYTEKDRQKYEDLAQLVELGVKTYFRGYLCCIGVITRDQGGPVHIDRGKGETWKSALLDMLYKKRLEAETPRLRWEASQELARIEANYADDIDECPETERN